MINRLRQWLRPQRCQHCGALLDAKDRPVSLSRHINFTTGERIRRLSDDELKQRITEELNA